MTKPKAKSTATSELAAALVEAINITKPVAKKTISSRVKNTPWTPKDGSAKIKLKRKMFQHALPIDEDKVNNEEVTLLNQIKPGVYCDGFLKVYRRKDRGIDIDYPVKTASQRLRLINDYGIVSLKSLLERVIEEAKNPKKLEDEDVEA